MSQAKVERYKEEKRNRKETMARDKRKRMVSTAALAVVGVVLLGWIGTSAYQVYENSKPMETIYTDLTALDDYMAGLEADAKWVIVEQDEHYELDPLECARRSREYLKILGW